MSIDKPTANISRTNICGKRIMGILKEAERGLQINILAGAVTGIAGVTRQDANGAPIGMLVLAELIEPVDYENLRAEVIEVLGEATDPDNGIKAIFSLYNIDLKFTDAVLQEAEQLPAEVGATIIESELANGRHDLRHLPTMTIDGIDAKDLDDALSIETVPEGYKVYIHIADVSHYVKEDSLIDLEAAKRGTSIYPVDRVVPMLPVRLSNGICSLNPNLPRLTLTVELLYDKKGNRLSGDVYESIIQSNLRADYKTAYEILVKGQATPEYEEMFPSLVNLNKLAKKLTAKRKEKGCFDFDFPETKVQLAQDGKPLNIYPYESNFVNQLIEEFMVAANEYVAERFARLEAPFLYRVHDKPDKEKIARLLPLCRQLKLKIKPGFINDRLQQAKFLAELHGLPQGEIMAGILLRSMAKACYEIECKGHYGLALQYYSHFTSPIRRYPDLFIHRVIKGYLHDQVQKAAWKLKAGMLAESCSVAERRAMAVERDTTDLKIAEYMAERLGEVYLAVISGFCGAGMFVRLPNTVEGMIPFRTMADYYVYNEGDYHVKGERSGLELQIGMAVKVQVAAVDRLKNRIDFVWVDEINNRTKKNKPPKAHIGKKKEAERKKSKGKKQLSKHSGKHSRKRTHKKADKKAVRHKRK